MPVLSIDEIAQYPITILLYPAGASGEFLAWALSESLTGFTKPHCEWENHSRCKYSDVLGRSLNGGNNPILEHKVIERFNTYVKNNQLGSQHLALCHTDRVSLEFVQRYFSQCAIIEITTTTTASLTFRYNSQSKITDQDIENAGRQRDEHYFSCPDLATFLNKHKPATLTFSQPHLKVEWERVILTDTANEFERIAEFVNCAGSADTFQSMVTDYALRNNIAITCCTSSTPK